MPFFSNKFSPKKTPTRKSESSIVSRELGPEFASRELGLEIPTIKLKLGEHEIIFDNGQWIPETGASGSTYKDNIKLRKSLKTLEEENNLLKLKFELLLDMLAQTTAESQIQLKEIEQLKHFDEKSNRLKIKGGK